ncbi:MAG: aminotransferase class I/II-fold pyridoxal phosphate-dependent enzyme [bacterium]|nr:aminotransferase class I/II-fold pyridoxal phosphate-dependent enzyme [bacterium]
MIDLRSDTVTKPTPGMLEAMFNAEVGDDVFEEDPTVKKLEEKVAATFGMEAALYCPSGTMTNQIALRVNTQPQDEVICDKRSHIYLYEGGGMASNSMVSSRLVDGDRGRIDVSQIEANINPDDIHFPRTSLVSLENTVNKGGGCYYSLFQISKIGEFCKANGLRTHLDGARVFNALQESQEQPSAYGDHFNTISVCFSKGLGAPVGSALLGSKEDIKKAKRVRKVFGGGMRQAGYLAAACIYALDNHVERLTEDHRRARSLGEAFEGLPITNSILSVDTNIVIVNLKKPYSPASVLAKLEEKGIRAVPFGPEDIRFVTHLDYDDNQLDETIEIVKKISF